MSGARSVLDEDLSVVVAALTDAGYEVVDTLYVGGVESHDPDAVRWRVEFEDTRAPGAGRGLARVWRSSEGPFATVAARDEYGRGTLVSVREDAGALRRYGPPSPFVSNADYRRLVAAASALSPAARGALRVAAALPPDPEDPLSLIGTPELERYVTASRVLDLAETLPEDHEDTVRLALDLASGVPAEWALHRAARRG